MTGMVYTVSQINQMLKGKLDGDPAFQDVFVRGEISNFTHHMKTGHFYFTIKDQSASIKAIMFQWNTRRLRFLPQNGMNVILFGNIQLFERDGICQVNCLDMQPDGVGALAIAFEQLKAKLAAQGIFDPAHKRPLPPLPKKIGVVTSKNGAALQDIRQILSRRYPVAELILFPVLVQGENAPESICAGIAAAQNAGLDVLIVGRGGGSLEDLWAFNDERVALAIYNSRVPVISAVGHEVDVTIADLAADLRAPTPSAAAELAVPDRETILASLADVRERLAQAAGRILDANQSRCEALAVRLEKNSPENRCRMLADRLDSLKIRLSQQESLLIERPAARLRQNAAKLEALSPLKVLLRGYAAVFDGKQAVSSVSKLEKGDRVSIRFADGSAEAEILAVSPERNEP